MRERLAVSAYFVSACLARGADAGAIVGLVLLADRVAPHTVTAGILAACLTAPHLAGPLAARLLDRTPRKRLFLASAFALYAISLAGTTALLFQHRVALAALVAIVAGACGPLLTGGLSSLLGSLVRDDEAAQRRAQGMDAFTYGVAATGGPALIAIVAAAVSPMASVLAAASLAILAALALLAMPGYTATTTSMQEPALRIRDAIALVLRTGTLRRVVVGTAFSALPIGALSLLAIAFALDHSATAVQGALLVTANGIGSLVGSIVLIVRPLRGEPDRLILWWTAAVAAGFALCAVSPSIVYAAVAFFLTGAATSIQFAANLAARALFSPPTARAQIFVTMAGVKTAFSSIGVALVGIATGVPSMWLLAAGVLFVLIGLVYMLADGARSRRLSPSQSR